MQHLQVLLILVITGFSSCASNRPSLNKVEKQIESLVNETAGTYAIAFSDLSDTSRQILINEQVVFHAASTMKTPVMMEIFKQAQDGQIGLYDKVLVKNQFTSIVDGSLFSIDINEDSDETLYHQIGNEVSVFDLMYNMIINSSNLATNILIEKIGAENVTRTMRELGATDIKILRGVEDIKAYRKGMSNTTTAFDLMVLFRQIGQNSFLDEVSCRRMTNILLDQKHNELIPAHLPPGVKVAHKTGFITKILHDSGLVILPDGRKYVLVVLSKEWKNREEATETIARISKMIYDFYTSND
ncbi:MAG: serine hydrolase [Bacteroidetes bacterium]|nr:MAG: serine hydrolase [Bacteroidota bacterium]